MGRVFGPLSKAKVNQSNQRVVGHNGVAIDRYDYVDEGYRSYEVHQRERVGQSTEKINGVQLASAEYQRNPYPLLRILREHYPCYRDWINNCYWITRYDDVTSIFTDEANFQTRSKLWYYGLPDFGRNLGERLPVQRAWTDGVDQHALVVAADILAGAGQTFDLAADFAAAYPLLLLARVLGLPEDQVDDFALHYWQAQRGAGWEAARQVAGGESLTALVDLFQPLLHQQQDSTSQPTLLSALVAEGASAQDVVATLLEYDHQTLHGTLANYWMQLLIRPDALRRLRGDRLGLKIAYLESLRHSPCVLTAERFARHEVERFGRLIPEGALMRLSALAANRDPRLFADADEFVVDRSDICHREARGQYRADGLPTGITFGLGPPSKHPAVPEDRPRSAYAVTRDTVLAVTELLLEQYPNLALADGAEPFMQALSIGEVYCCWRLPVVLGSQS